MQEVKKSHNQDMKAGPASIEFKLRVNRIQSWRFCWLYWLRAVASFPGVKGPGSSIGRTPFYEPCEITVSRLVW